MSKQTLISILENHVHNKGDEIVYHLIQDDEASHQTLSYRQLYTQAHVLAGHIAKQAGKGERALMLFDNGAEFIIAFFACLMSGVVAVPVYPPRKRDDGGRLANIVNDAKPAMILTTAKIATLSKRVFAGDMAFAELPQLITDDQNLLPCEGQLPELNGHDPAFLQYSSGSTGAPKGVIISHRNIVHNQACFAEASGNTEHSSSASWLPYFHDMGLSGGILQPVYVGFPCYLMNPGFFLQKPLRWLKVMSDHRIRASGAPNFAWDLCIDKITDEQLEGIDLSAWQVAYHGAEPISADTLKRFAERFAQCGFSYQANFPCYGMAEATLFVSGRGLPHVMPVVSADADALAQNKMQLSRKKAVDLVSCGRTWGDSQIRVVDSKTCKPLADDEVGEIWFASDSVAHGYWNNSQATQAAFGHSLAETDDAANGRYLRTGDLGFIHEGQLYVTGRLKDMIIINGRNYYPHDIEQAVFGDDPQLVENHCAAFGIDGEQGETVVVVQEVKRTALRKINVTQTIKAIRERVAQHTGLALADVVLIKTGSIAKTSSGKVQRVKNKTDYLQGKLTVVGAGKKAVDRAGLTEWITNHIAEQVKVNATDIGLDDNFLSLGLNSLKAVEFVEKLSQFSGNKASATLVYDFPTINLLVGHLCGDKQLDKEVRGNSPVNKSLVKDIAVIGMACRLPGADNIEQFWHNLSQGRSSIRPFPEDRYYGIEPNSDHYYGGYLDDVDAFDDKFFSLTAKEAKLIDPQHRVLLELAHNAMRHAGYQPNQLVGSPTGVFIGISQSDYLLLCAQSDEYASPYVGTGTAMCMAANRISYFYDFRGPSQVIDTACSSSLVALDAGVKSLRQGDCGQVLVGGVKMVLFSDGSSVLKHAQMLSAKGACQPFDAGADGYVRAEGAGLVLLKPMGAAQQDNDNIIAVIKGTAVNQDGRSNGITAPNGNAQQRVINAALNDAGVTAEQVSYVEAHGTGTPLGDPIEVNALAQVYGKADSRRMPLLIGSVKANIGHLEPAAGIAGLIKTLLCLQHQQLPQQVHFQQPSGHIPWQDIAIKVNDRLQPWQDKEQRLLTAGVSSFGFGGTNSHVIVQQAPEPLKPAVDQTKTMAILALKARDPQALVALKHAFASHIEQHQSVSLARLCAQFNQQLEEGTSRCTVVAANHQDMIIRLREAQDETDHRIAKPGFMFTGQGSQYLSMGYQLYQTQPLFKAQMQACEDCYQAQTGQSLLALIYPETQDEQSQLDQTRYTQPALFAIEYALAKLWLSLGVEPQVVMGHSIGEYAAACIAGVFSLQQAMKLVIARGQLIQQLPQGGAMLAIKAGEQQVKPYLGTYDKLAFAAINGPQAVVVSGCQQQLQQLQQQLDSAAVVSTRLKVSHAFHSPLMNDALAPFKAVAEQVDFQPPKITFVSTVTGKVESEALTSADYWVEHIHKTVLFEQGLGCALAGGVDGLIEIGPEKVLCNMAKSMSANCYPSMSKTSDDLIMHSLAKLFEQGVEVNWPKSNIDNRVSLPSYPFARNRHWVNVNPYFSAPHLQGRSQGPVQTEEVQPIEQHFYRQQWQSAPFDTNQPQTLAKHWLLVSGEDQNCQSRQLMDSLQQHLTQLGLNCERLYLTDNKTRIELQLGHWDSPGLIVHSTSLDAVVADDTAASQLNDLHRNGYGTALALMQACLAAHEQGILATLPRLCLLSASTQSPAGELPSGWLHNSLWGLGKVLAQEHPEFHCANIDVADVTGEQLFHELGGPGHERQVALSKDNRYVQRLQALPNNPLAAAKVNFDPRQSYLITGGLGDLALTAARWMIRRGARHLVLVARRSVDEQTDCGRQFIALKKQTPGVQLVQADVTNYAELGQIIDTIAAGENPLGGVFHFAGTLNDKAIGQQQFDDFTTVAEVKASAAWQLHLATKNLKLEHFVVLSSAAALFGSTGQANYAAANAVTDGLSDYRRQLGLPALTIQLGMVADIGMAAKRSLDTQSAGRGITPITPTQFIDTLEKLIGGAESVVGPVVGVVPVDWHLWQKQVAHWPFLTEFKQQGDFKPSSKKAAVTVDLTLPGKIKTRQSSHGSSSDIELLVTRYLNQQIADIGEFSCDNIDSNVSLLNLGLDSLMLVELQRRILSDLEIKIEMALLLQGGAVIDVARMISGQLSVPQRIDDDEEEAAFEEGLL